MAYCSVCVLVFGVLVIGVAYSNGSRLLDAILPSDYMQQLENQQQKLLLIGDDRKSIGSSSIGHDFYMDRRSIQNCAEGAGTDEETLLSMDRLCEACHEMYRHRDPNIRANCRHNCFDNDDFVFCFNHFAGGVQVSRGI